MIQNPWALIILFVGLVAALTWARGRYPPAFKFLPLPFWCYFLPMCLATAGVFPPASPAYDFLSRYVLPPCLALLLINVSLPSLARLGRPALLAMAIGAAGICTGAVLGYALAAPFLPEEAWKAVGALSASWVGGSANMLAVKEALATPDAILAPVIVVDTIFAYSWMALLISLAGRQKSFDRWVKAPDRLSAPAVPPPSRRSLPWVLVPLAAIIVATAAILAGDTLGMGLSLALRNISPRVGASFSPATWTVLFVTTFALLASLTGKFTAAPERTERLGTFALYVLLASLGARASLLALGRAPAFLAVGACIIVLHGLFLLAGGRWFRLPLFVLASASQACVGGVVSAPMVSAVYRPELSAIGLLLAILGNVTGTYIGIVVAQLCAMAGGKA